MDTDATPFHVKVVAYVPRLSRGAWNTGAARLPDRSGPQLLMPGDIRTTWQPDFNGGAATMSPRVVVIEYHDARVLAGTRP
jgi:hypothetical protein